MDSRTEQRPSTDDTHPWLCSCGARVHYVNGSRPWASDDGPHPDDGTGRNRGHDSRGGRNPAAFVDVGVLVVGTRRAVTYRDQTYATASWWREYRIAPGLYAVRRRRWTGWADGPTAGDPQTTVTATVTGAYFPASFAGNPASSPGTPAPDKHPDVGRVDTVTKHPRVLDALDGVDWLGGVTPEQYAPHGFRVYVGDRFAADVDTLRDALDYRNIPTGDGGSRIAAGTVTAYILDSNRTPSSLA